MKIQSGFYTLLFFISLSCQHHKLITDKEAFTVYENSINDSFLIKIDTYRHTKKTDFDRIVFYFDANLKSGKQIREFFNDPFDSNTLLVGIAHLGNYREKRRRDFMNDDTKIGVLLDSIIIPQIKDEYGWGNQRIIIGHSLAGLWVYQNFMNGDTTFTTSIAISPSLWYKRQYEKSFDSSKVNTSNSMLYIYWGGKERLNYVRSACRALRISVFTKLTLSHRIMFKEIKGKGHNSTVKQALRYSFVYSQ
ncbi:MAG TPA: hypothetical protein VEC12_12485 [Bacteroidia bacterium]|nr:hypothetical protein [Bacteroidia bacterium]